MSAANQTPDRNASTANGVLSSRVTTIISCPGVHPMARTDAQPGQSVANENHWFDRIGFRRRYLANAAAAAFTLLLLWGGVWIVQEFSRLQKLEACYEAGRRDCSPLNMNRKGG